MKNNHLSTFVLEKTFQILELQKQQSKPGKKNFDEHIDETLSFSM